MIGSKERNMNNTFSKDESGMLANLIGQRLRFIAGPDLWHPLTAPSVYIVTEGESISLDATCVEYEFDGDWEDFCQIHISKPNVQGVEAAVGLGYAYKKYSGEKIMSVKIISDKISGVLNGQTNFDYTSHSGVVIEFAHGCIAIMKLDHHQPILKVIYGEDLESKNIEYPSHRFNEDVFQSFTFEREEISIE
jgi:hypothetical protein